MSQSKGLEVLVYGSKLDVGWTDEAAERVGTWPPPSDHVGDTLPALVEAASSYAERERAAAGDRAEHPFDKFARVRIEAGALTDTAQLDVVVGSLRAAGFTQLALQVGRDPLEVHLPLAPRSPAVEAGGGTGYGFARLRWGRTEQGVWVDGDVAYSEPARGEDAAPGARPDLPVGLRSPWSCALVEPEPTFIDAVRRATSALKKYELPGELPIYVELAPGASFAEGWQLAREVRANGHDQVSFLRGTGALGIPENCPAEAGNAARLVAAAQGFLGQRRDETGHVGSTLDFFGLTHAL